MLLLLFIVCLFEVNIFLLFFLTLEIVTRTEKGGLSWPDWELIH